MATVSSEGALRAALAALGANGGFPCLLRLPGLAVSGSDAEQLGLATPQFQDVPVGPVVWRRLANATELLMAADSISNLLGSESFASAQSLFEAAVGVVIDDVVYVISESEAVLVGGAPCAYRLRVQRPMWA